MINRRALVRIVAGCALAATLSGCNTAGHGIAEQSVAFDSRSPDSIVIVGIRSERPTDLIFKRYDPETNRLVTEGSGNEFVTRYSNFNKDRYKVHLVKPGPYALHEIESNTREGYTNIRNFSTFGKKGDPVISNSAPVFTVAAGEIVYVGDFGVNNTDIRAAAGLKVDVDAKAAREALAAYPGIKGEMKTRPLRAVGAPKKPAGT